MCKCVYVVQGVCKLKRDARVDLAKKDFGQVHLNWLPGTREQSETIVISKSLNVMNGFLELWK